MDLISTLRYAAKKKKQEAEARDASKAEPAEASGDEAAQAPREQVGGVAQSDCVREEEEVERGRESS